MDNTLRPQSFGEYIGQEKVKKNLDFLFQAAKKRKEPIEHILLYGPAGLGKTTLANIIAKEMGVNIKTTSGPAIERVGDFGSILTNLQDGDILFIDEIHRLNKSIEEILYPGMEDFKLDIIIGKGPSARTMTQSSLLECMEQRQATVDNVTHRIDPPFMVIATQNPIEYEGTYPLPEAQLDRFMMRLSLGYPAPEAEEAVIQEQTSRDALSELEPVLSGSEVLAMTKAVTRVRVAPALRRYVVDILTASRNHRDLYLGGSPRAGIALTRAAKALALLRGRDFVIPKDVKDLAVRCLAHRVMLSPDAKVHGSRYPAPRGPANRIADRSRACR